MKYFDAILKMYFDTKKADKCFSSCDYGNKIDTSLFVQKPYPRTKYLDGNIEEDDNSKNQYSIKNLPEPVSIREAASKNYVDKKINDPSIIENTSDMDLNDKSFTNVKLIEINQWLEIGDQLRPKLYIDNVIRNSLNDSSLLRLDPDEKLILDERSSIVLNSTLTSPRTIIGAPIKKYVDNKFSDPSIIKNTAQADFNDKNLENVRLSRVNSMPAVGERLTAKN